MDAFEAIADTTRRSLLRRLADGPVRVVDLAAAYPISRPAISRHLRVLGDAGLVRSTDHGRERHYSLAPAPLAEIGTFVNDLLATDAGRARTSPITTQHLDALETEVRRTSRDRRRRSTVEAAQRKESA
ncbi:MAG: metalloregulator ArsR/SmtB family transcription factor [Ilumatobacteraceae bacterium]